LKASRQYYRHHEHWSKWFLQTSTTSVAIRYHWPLSPFVSILPLGRILASMFSIPSCFPPFFLTSHMKRLSETHLAYLIVFFPLVFFLSSNPLLELYRYIGHTRNQCRLWDNRLYRVLAGIIGRADTNYEKILFRDKAETET